MARRLVGKQVEDSQRRGSRTSASICMKLVLVKFRKSSMETLRTHRAVALRRRGAWRSYSVSWSRTLSSHTVRQQDPRKEISCPRNLSLRLAVNKASVLSAKGAQYESQGQA